MLLPKITHNEFGITMTEISDFQWYENYYKRILLHPKFEDTWKTIVLCDKTIESPDSPLKDVFVTSSYHFLIIIRLFEAYCQNNNIIFPLPKHQSSMFITFVNTAIIEYRAYNSVELIAKVENENPLLFEYLSKTIPLSISAKRIPERMNISIERIFGNIFIDSLFGYVLMDFLFTNYEQVLPALDLSNHSLGSPSPKTSSEFKRDEYMPFCKNCNKSFSHDDLMNGDSKPHKGFYQWLTINYPDICFDCYTKSFVAGNTYVCYMCASEYKATNENVINEWTACNNCLNKIASILSSVLPQSNNNYDPNESVKQYMEKQLKRLDEADKYYKNQDQLKKEHSNLSENSQSQGSSSNIPKYPTSASQSNSNSSEGCFIATAVFGSYEHPIVKEFRCFRDVRLSKSKLGKFAISVYYHISPSLVPIISSKPLTLIKYFLKWILMCFYYILKRLPRKV